MKPYLKMTHYNQPLIIPREECPVTNLSSSWFRNWPSNSSRYLAMVLGYFFKWFLSTIRFLTFYVINIEIAATARVFEEVLWFQQINDDAKKVLFEQLDNIVEDDSDRHDSHVWEPFCNFFYIAFLHFCETMGLQANDIPAYLHVLEMQHCR